MLPATPPALPALLLDTTHSGLNMALQTAQGALHQTQLHQPRTSAQLHPLLADLLDNAHIKPEQVQTLAVAVGPGSFTGARVAVAVAEAWHLAQPHTRCVGLNSLHLCAHHVRLKLAPTTPFRLLTDAAGGQAYVQDFSPDATPINEAACLALPEATQTLHPIAAFGLPLLEEATWHIALPCAEALVAALHSAAAHSPLEAQYLKPLTYRTKTAS